MAEDKKKVPVEEWIPHPPSDWVEWMDHPAKHPDQLTPEERVKFDAAVAERLAKENAAKEGRR